LTRATGGAGLRDRIVVQRAPHDTALRDHLGRVLGMPVDIALGVGPARVNRKPVLQVFDGDGRTVAFAKVGDSAQARCDVRAETRALRRLAGHRFEHLQVPAVLAASTWNGMDVLVVSPLRGVPTLRRRAAVRPPLEAMAELSGAFGEAPRPLAELAWWRRQLTTARAGDDGDLRRRLVRCLAALDEEHGRTTVDVGAWHGDWTPWNMARHRSRVMLWDWERFESGVPVGLDPWHHRVQTATRARGIDVAVVLSALQPGGSADPRAGLVADLYLAAVAGRYAALLDAERGADITGPAEVMVSALEARIRRVRSPGRGG
ncbi:phosphotransferase, partial [Nocardioides plantarum]